MGGRKGVHEALAPHVVKSASSIREHLSLAKKASEGSLGPDVQSIYEGIEQGISSYVDEDITEKTASLKENDYNTYDELATRLTRLETLLRK